MSLVTKYPRSAFDWNDFGSLMNAADDFWRNGSRRTSVAAPVEISETDEHLTVEVELPGFDRDDIKVNLDKNVLTISGERKFEADSDQKRRYHLTERSYGRFARSFTLPGTVDADKIQASYKDGLLALSLPKVEAAKPREIAVS